MPLALVGQALAGNLEAAARGAAPLRPQLRDPLGDRAGAGRGRRPRRGWDGAADRGVGRRLARRPDRRRRDRRRHRLARRVRCARRRDAAADPARRPLRRATDDRRAAREPAPARRRSASSAATARSPAPPSSAPCSASSAASPACSCRSRSPTTACRPAGSGSRSGSRPASGSPPPRSSAGCGRRPCTCVASGIAVAVLAGAWLLPAFRLSTLALVAFLLVSTGCRSMINALNYAVGVRASEGTSAPMVIGVMNLAWAVTALVTPLLAGLAEGSSEVRFAFAATGVAPRCRGLLLVPRPRARSPPPRSTAAGRALADGGYTSDPLGPLAQLVEQGTLNPKVEGSNPSRPTYRSRKPARLPSVRRSLYSSLLGRRRRSGLARRACDRGGRSSRSRRCWRPVSVA